MNPNIGLFLVLPAFVAFWCFACVMVARMSGWRKMAEHYRTRETPPGRKYSFASMQCRTGFWPANYGSCLFVRVSDQGLGLAVLPLWRPGHPPLFIPWGDVASCEQKQGWFFMRTEVELVEPPLCLVFTGTLGKAIFDACPSGGEITS